MITYNSNEIPIEVKNNLTNIIFDQSLDLKKMADYLLNSKLLSESDFFENTIKKNLLI